MAIHFSIERKGRTFRARADGAQAFFVGYATSYTDKSSGEDFEGLYNVPSNELPKLTYDADDLRPLYGFWADFVAPTARCEGGNFLTLNTYDRARFTWGFGQFAAHVADGDFVVFLRDLLQRAEAVDYFPNLRVVQGRIVKVEGDVLVPLETAQSTRPLMLYLNPTTTAVEDAEVIAAAKLIHWTTHVAAARELQAQHMVGTFKRLLREADKRLGLDGRAADICCVICDIRHQGRAKFSAMAEALANANPLTELLKLGSIAYPERIKTLKAALAASAGLFAGKTWSRASGDFV
jgi:hypothetical protein